MMQRNLTITLEPDWKAALRATAKFAKAKTYQGEVLNFETPAHFFGQLTERRWELVRTAQGRGEISVRELARLVNLSLPLRPLCARRRSLAVSKRAC